ncbi:YhbY family RNA-binding protein [Metallibacterium scheffleri]|uniref:RNA-binding protein n=1 Tax=Metallibacterium scheffleri TaxID=993689 RepID=A0A4S3KJT0_9GAMM|nr:YhbY family RNA-binding protein [Metallibacterium scheffleri]THD09053.1 RNA-binding protein [Metallibacterium scheffleri]
MALTSSQVRYLRGMAHPLKPVLQLGGRGVTPALLRELDAALDRHELVKVRLTGADRAARAELLDALLAGSGADLVQRIGHIASLFRRNAEEPKLALPR